MEAEITLVLRLTLMLVFVASAAAKLRDLRGFRRTLRELRLLPTAAVAPVALAVPFAEVVAVGLLGLGGPALLAGFVFAAGLLGLFTLALASGLARGVAAPCHCFGASERPLNRFDLARNGALIAAAVLGAVTSPGAVSAIPGLAELLLAALGASALALFLIHLGELLEAVGPA